MTFVFIFQPSFLNVFYVDNLVFYEKNI